MAPDPFVPDVSTPMKLTTVMDMSPLPELALTEIRLMGEAAKARQTSAVPVWLLVLLTSVHVSRFPLETPAMVELEPVAPGAAATNANSNSLLALVENTGVFAPPVTI
jgi:hypothetical protein